MGGAKEVASCICAFESRFSFRLFLLIIGLSACNVVPSLYSVPLCTYLPRSCGLFSPDQMDSVYTALFLVPTWNGVRKAKAR